MLPIATALTTIALGASSFESYVKSHNTPQFASRSTGTSSSLGDKTITTRTFFDVTIDGKAAGRIVIGLYGNAVRPTVRNHD